MIDGKTKIYGIFGYPVGHTRSPALHNAAFGHLGMNARYIPFEVDPKDLLSAVEGIRAMNLCGVNVTVPHKEAILPLLDEVHGIAAELGAVNVVVNREGVLLGYNTDVEGFRLSVEAAGVSMEGEQVVILGAGGAAKSVVRAVQNSGAKTIAIFNRTKERADAIAENFSGRGAPIDVWEFSDPEVDSLFENSAIIINTTSQGLRNEDTLPVAPELLKKHHTLVDIIYHPWETPFLAAGREIGAETVNGYGMLVFQALEAFHIWTGERPPVKIMWDAGLENN